MFLLTGALLIAVLALSLASAYLLFLSVVGLFYRSSARPETDATTKFAILVPAHNEEILLPSLLESLGTLEYPKRLLDVYVVADNCSDTTAKIGRSYGAAVFERQNPDLRGKGYALQWLLSQIRPRGEEYDAYVFIDADSLVSPNLLTVMDGKFRSGALVIQAHYGVSNPVETWVSALRYIAFELMNYVRPLGRQVLGLSCGLFGTGMAFRKSVLDEHGWDAFTLADDAEYSLKLIESRVKVDFGPEAAVWSQMPASLRDAKTQNLRWERGRLYMAWRYGIRFLAEGIFTRDLAKVDAAIQQLIPPLSFTFVAATVLLAVSLLVGRGWLVGLGLATNLALMGHVVLGLRSVKAPWQVYRAFVFAPGFVLWKTWVYVQALVPREMGWTRTDRSQR